MTCHRGSDHTEIGTSVHMDINDNLWQSRGSLPGAGLEQQRGHEALEAAPGVGQFLCHECLGHNRAQPERQGQQQQTWTHCLNAFDINSPVLHLWKYKPPCVRLDKPLGRSAGHR
jgi:hypothetical protein